MPTGVLTRVEKWHPAEQFVRYDQGRVVQYDQGVPEYDQSV